MSFVATAIIGSGVIGAGASLFGSSQQVSAEKSAQAQLAQQQQQTQQLIQNYLGPYAQTGQAQLPAIQSLIQGAPQAPTAADISKIPGYEFGLKTGEMGQAALATTRGLGGNALTAENQFAQGYAAENYPTWYNALLSGYQAKLNPLLSLYGSGAGAAGNIASTSAGVAQSFAPAIAQTTVGQGNAIAGGATGAAGALGSGLQNALLAKALGINPLGFYGSQQPVSSPNNFNPNATTSGWY